MRAPDANPVITLAIATLADEKGWSQANGGNASSKNPSWRRAGPKSGPLQQCCEKAGRLVFVASLTLWAGLTHCAFGAPKSVQGGHTSRTKAPSMAVNRPNRDRGPRVILRIYNYVHLPPRPLVTAEHAAESILAAAGLEARWVDCPLTEAEAARYPLCGQPMPPVSLVFYIVPDTMAGGLPSPPNALGLALSCSYETPACCAYIFYDRIQNWLRQGGTVSSYEILGRTIAHEVGHLLLGPDSHSLTGIMRAAWNEEDLEFTTGASLSSTRFTYYQAKELRTELTRRTAGQD